MLIDLTIARGQFPTIAHVIHTILAPTLLLKNAASKEFMQRIPIHDGKVVEAEVRIEITGMKGTQ